MFENKLEEKTENPSCSFSMEATEEEMFLDELVDDAVWEVCFDVHRAAKLGYFFLDNPGNTDEKKEDIQNANKTSKDAKTKVLVLCPYCNSEKSAIKFTSHFTSCTSVRRIATNKKIQDGASFENDDDSEENSYCGSDRKKLKNKKKNPKNKGSSVPKSSLDITSNHDDMTHEERKTFFTQKCGVVSKRTNKMCIKTQKCSNHTDEQRRDVRDNFNLRDMSDPLTDGQLDIDTVDEGNHHVFSFINQSLPPYVQ